MCHQTAVRETGIECPPAAHLQRTGYQLEAKWTERGRKRKVVMVVKLIAPKLQKRKIHAQFRSGQICVSK